MIGRWRSHAHVTALVRIPDDQWHDLFDQLADAAHDLDEQVTCTGSLADTPIARFEVTGYRMRRREAQALRDRVAAALRWHEPAPTETHTILRPRCRCDADRGGARVDVGGLVLLACLAAYVLGSLGAFGERWPL